MNNFHVNYSQVKERIDETRADIRKGIYFYMSKLEDKRVEDALGRRNTLDLENQSSLIFQNRKKRKKILLKRYKHTTYILCSFLFIIFVWKTVHF